jgi:hypothetical protein
VKKGLKMKTSVNNPSSFKAGFLMVDGCHSNFTDWIPQLCSPLIEMNGKQAF